jgi:hypothetical protein
MGNKRCFRCKQHKNLDLFHKCARNKDGRQSFCKECQQLYAKEDEKRTNRNKKRYHEKKDEYLEACYKRKYGITLNEYNRMLEDQGGVCAVCGKVCNSGKRLAVDHNHLTGKVRGLLCINCNQGIGHLMDSIHLLSRAIDYLELTNT